MASPRSKSLALHVLRSRSFNSDTAEDGEGVEPSPDNSFRNTLPNELSENQEVSPAERNLTGDSTLPVTALLNTGGEEAENRQSGGSNREEGQQVEADRLFIHLRDNMEKIREFCKDMVQQIPIPEQCAIEGNVNTSSEIVVMTLSIIHVQQHIKTVVIINKIEKISSQ